MKKYQKEDGISYVLGAYPSIEFIKARPQAVSQVFVSSRYDHAEALAQLCHSKEIPYVQDDRTIAKLSDKENVFVIAQFRLWEEALSDATHIVLVHPENMGNLGTIIRAIVGFGIHDLALIRPAVDVFDPKTVRASMGALAHIRVHYYDTFKAYQDAFPDRPLYPFMLQADDYLDRFAFPSGPCALVFGPEGNGLTPDFLVIGHPLKIRQNPEVDSFNLPIAVSLAAYEFSKQRGG